MNDDAASCWDIVKAARQAIFSRYVALRSQVLEEARRRRSIEWYDERVPKLRSDEREEMISSERRIRADFAAVCSCHMCENPRRRGELTMQERRATEIA